jgi:hypothetical protein
MAYTLRSGFLSAIMRRLKYVPSHPYEEGYEEVRNQLVFRDLANPPRWDDLARFKCFWPDLRYALPLPEHLFHTLPKVQIKLKPKDVMADLTGRDDLELVSERFRDLIEKVAPGAAQFIPATLIDDMGQPITRFGPRYFMNILDFVTPIELFAGTNVVPEVTRQWQFKSISYSPVGIYSPKEDKKYYTVSAAAVAGRNLFRSIKIKKDVDGICELHSTPSEIYISNHLAQSIKKARFTNIVMYWCNEV